MRFAAVGYLLMVAGFAVAQPKKKEPGAEYKPVTGEGWKADFPKGEPKKEPNEIPTAAGTVRTHTTLAEVGQGRDLVVSVTVAEYPDHFRDLDPKTILNGVRDGLKGKDGKLTAESDVTELNGRGVAGIEVRVEAGRNAVRCRAFLVENRLFQVMAAGTKEAVGGKVADHVLKSFELTP